MTATLRRTVLVCAVALSASAASAGAATASAHATKHKPKPKPLPPVCNLITDPAGDATGTGISGVSTPSSDPNMDILSADIATNATTITAVVRLAAYNNSDSNWPLGQSFDVAFRVDGQPADLRGTVSPAGSTWGGGKGTGSEDPAKKEVHISMALGDLGVPVSPKSLFTDLAATTARYVGTTDVTLGVVDAATSTATYAAGRASCVKVGS